MVDDMVLADLLAAVEGDDNMARELAVDLSEWAETDLQEMVNACDVVRARVRDVQRHYVREIQRRSAEAQLAARYGTLSVAEAEAVLAHARAREQTIHAASAVAGPA